MTGVQTCALPIFPGQESRVLIDTDDIGLDGSVSSAESEGSAWIGALGEDLCLGGDVHDGDDDDNTVDEGVPVADAIEGDHISDSGLWDEPAVAAWHIPRRCDDDDDGLDGSCPSLSQLHSRSGAFIQIRHVPDLMAQHTECWSCVACKSNSTRNMRRTVLDQGCGPLLRECQGRVMPTSSEDQSTTNRYAWRH